MYIIFGNYGNETIALIQWASRHKLDNVYVVSVDTGWAAQQWEQRVSQSEQLAKQHGFIVERLKSKSNFAQLIEHQQDFPSTKHQWCAGFLKGLVFFDWLDILDPAGKAWILLPKRRAISPILANLPEFIEESEHYGERKVWHPLYDCSDEAMAKLIFCSGVSYLPHRSLECDPCVNNTRADFMRLQSNDIKKTVCLEKTLQKPMFAPLSYGGEPGIEQVITWVKRQKKSAHVVSLAVADMGCGTPFVCGL